tara:strand:- start:1535 stop:1810 length:276 start_codon:yes stop_codon:yes gene_type:complete
MKIFKRKGNLPKVKVKRHNYEVGTVVEIQPFSLGRLHRTAMSKYKGQMGIIIDIGDKRPSMVDIMLFSGKHITIRKEFVKIRFDLKTRKGR